MTQTSSTHSLALRVVKGIHSGALIPLASIDTLLIGASDDCDVILSDAGVAKHHCILCVRGDVMTVRAVDTNLMVEGKSQEPGIGVALPHGASVELGGAEFEVAAHSCEAEAAEGARLDRRRPHGARMRDLFHRSRWAIGLVLFAAVAFELQPMELNAGPYSARSEATTAVVKSVVAADTRKSDDTAARDVAEVLRLSGISGQTVYEGNGTVTVRGHLGDPTNVASIVQSRAMHEIAGLKQVRVLNLDQEEPAPAPAAPVNATGDQTRIILAIGGNDPCVVTADGKRYYLGATLPQGGRLRGVQDGEVLLERSGRIVRLNPLDGRVTT
jgi:Inner membrane component of T3SS, cytoplasmic domain